jgi:hypothetical protein
MADGDERKERGGGGGEKLEGGFMFEMIIFGIYGFEQTLAGCTI